MTYNRKQLSEEEKRQVKEKTDSKCFVCGKEFLPSEDIEYDHIKSLKQCEKERIPESEANNLPNFAALHKICNRSKASENLNDIKDKLRIESNFNEDFEKVYKGDKEKAEVHIDEGGMKVRFDGTDLKLYKCPNTGLFYFFHSIPMKYIRKDTEIQPRLIYKDKLIKLAKHLKHNFQLSASACRLKEGEILLFDGQHKSAAQYLGNENQEVECKVITGPEKLMVDNVIERAHGDLRQMSFKSSELGKKIMHQFKDHIKRWKDKNPGKEPSEYDIFIGELQFGKGKSNRAITRMYAETIKSNVDCEISKHISKTKNKDLPLTDNMFNKIVKHFLFCEPLQIPIENENNDRQEELENFVTILNYIIEYSLKNKWNSNQPSSAAHKLAYTFYREAPMLVWSKMIADAIRLVLRKRKDDGICYGELFTEKQKQDIQKVIKRNFEHAVWSNPSIDFKTRDITLLEKELEKNGLDWKYLMEP